jgi:hypothetical protein
MERESLSDRNVGIAMSRTPMRRRGGLAARKWDVAWSTRMGAPDYDEGPVLRSMLGLG